MKELRIEGIFYLPMQDEETESEAILRFLDIINCNGIVESVADYSEQNT